MNLRLIYLHGFASGPGSKKARMFAGWFKEKGVELSVPALDGGDFRNLTLTGQLEVIEREAQGQPCALIGSSLGGYLAALYAARREEVQRLVLLAPAFGFARRWAASLGAEALEEWQRTGVRRVPHYGLGGEAELGWRLMEDAALYEEEPEAGQPTLIFHGVHDAVVPVEASLRYAARRPHVMVREMESDHELLDVAEQIFAETARFLQLN